MSHIEYNPFTYQIKFRDSTKPKVYLSTGFGGGKTYSLCMKGFRLMNLNRVMPGGILCPTLKMYKRDVLPTMKEIIAENNIPYSYNKTDMQWYFPDAEAIIYVFHSEDEGASIRGPNLAWGLINEVTLVDRMAFLAFIARIRLKKAKLRQLAMSGTPEGFNWNYEYFVEKPRDDTDLIFGNCEDNTYNADDYIPMLRDSYDPLMQEQYIEGKFVNLTGKRCAYAFDRFKHTDNSITPLYDYPVLVSIDFNVSPMAAVLWNRVPYGLRGPNRGKIWDHDLRAFDEIKIESSNTYELAQALKEKTSKASQVILYPDPAGASRSTKGSLNVTDIDILSQAGFSDIRYNRKISVRDSLNATNNMFSKNRIKINAKACPNFVADCEQVVFREGVFEMDKSNSKRTHWIDGGKNMISYEFPVRTGRGFREQMIR